MKGVPATAGSPRRKNNRVAEKRSTSPIMIFKIFVMSSEVETSLITAQTESKRFLDFARNDKKVMRGIEQDRDRETRK
jgi:hypothetical protein